MAVEILNLNWKKSAHFKILDSDFYFQLAAEVRPGVGPTSLEASSTLTGSSISQAGTQLCNYPAINQPKGVDAYLIDQESLIPQHGRRADTTCRVSGVEKGRKVQRNSVHLLA